ncbi:hypothetical protein B7494_g1602 [Chlorociboria aeruginascens]|nr:hypothetical protein B7494_g1602 [Chlorociboria aeruginascens]
MESSSTPTTSAASIASIVDCNNSFTTTPATSTLVNTSSQALLTFTCFPRLPGELRNRIWKFASLLPRVIDIFDIGVGTSILRTCSQARSIGMKYYTTNSLNFQTIAQPAYVPSTIFLNLDVDIICPPTRISKEADWAFCKSKIRHMAINVNDVIGFEDLRKDWQHGHWTTLSHLEEVILYNNEVDVTRFNEGFEFVDFPDQNDSVEDPNENTDPLLELERRFNETFTMFEADRERVLSWGGDTSMLETLYPWALSPWKRPRVTRKLLVDHNSH